jgi:Arc/MetJ-type ribon-helix-helix transcriptional regulator
MFARLPQPLVDWAEQEAHRRRPRVTVSDVMRDALEVLRELIDGTPSEAADDILREATSRI